MRKGTIGLVEGSSSSISSKGTVGLVSFVEY